MKRLTYLLLAGVTALSACKKNASKVVTNAPEEQPDTTFVDTSYLVSAFADITVNPLGMVNMPVTITRNSGTERRVSLSVSGVPSSVKAEFSRPSGYPTFTSSLEMDFMFTPPGHYPITLSTTPEGGRSKHYTATIHVEPLEDKECADLGASALRTNGATFKGSTSDTMIINGSTFLFNNPANNTLYFRNLYLYHDSMNSNMYISLRNGSTSEPNFNNAHVRMEFDCNDGLIIIPQQTVIGRMIPGSLTEEFIVAGSGKAIPAEKRYEIAYTTTHDDNGTTRTITYVMRGELMY